MLQIYVNNKKQLIQLVSDFVVAYKFKRIEESIQILDEIQDLDYNDRAYVNCLMLALLTKLLPHEKKEQRFKEKLFILTEQLTSIENLKMI